MESITQYNKGLNQDLSKNLDLTGYYYYMLNGSISTDSGLTDYNPTNIKGNRLFNIIPDTYNIYKITTTSSVGDTYDFDLTIDSQTNNFAGTFTSNDSLFQDINDWIDSIPALRLLGTKLRWNNNYALAYSTTHNINISVVNNVGGLSVNLYIVAQQDLFVIGWGCVREDIYLFTTNVTIPSPNSGVGQIWRLRYNKVTLAVTIELVYNNYLNFTIEHPIANPGQFVGRYETPEIQRIYWTDNFNPLRSLNVANPQVFATDLSLLNAETEVSFDIALLQRVSLGGNIPVGSYQVSYRLKTTNGTITTFSEPSKLVYIVPLDEGICTGGAHFTDYVGANLGTQTSKQITWNIHSLDTDYERIEACIIKRELSSNVPVIEVFLDEPIPSSGNLDITYSGQDAITPLTVDEFNLLANSFSHTKCIASKDNILFAANVRRELSEINYDARAYRFPAVATGSYPSTDIEVNSGLTSTLTQAQLSDLNINPETSDDINPLPVTQIYRADGTTFGGDGPFVSYEFGTIALRADSTGDNNWFPDELSNSNPMGLRHTNSNSTITQFQELNVREGDNTEQVYPVNNINSSTKYVYYNSILRDYQRGETYRFGIQFFDKAKNPYFTKWIGDVIFPTCYMDDGVITNHIYEDGTLQPYSDYRLSFTANRVGYPEAFTKHLFIKLNIRIPLSLKGSISGYSIVRVKREANDKTILGEGIINPVQVNGTNTVGGGGTELYPPCPSTLTLFNTYLNSLGDDSTVGGNGRALNCTFDCPDFLLTGAPSYKSGDQIVINSKLAPTAFQSMNVRTFAISGMEQYKMAKWYDVIPIGYPNNTYNIEKQVTLNAGQNYSLQGTSGSGSAGYTFHNFVRERNTGAAPDNFGINDGSSLGAKTMFLELTTDFLIYNNYTCTPVSGYKLLAYYYRPNPLQYGGNTYSQRSLNEYISCSEFRPITDQTDSNADTIDQINVFGGDTFTSIFDNQKEIRYWTLEQAEATGSDMLVGTTTIDPSSNQKRSYSMFFPIQSICNSDLRHGQHPNTDVFANTGTTGDTSYFETYDYNPIYSLQNDFKSYFPKPSQISEVGVLDNRIYASDKKVNGELQDSWTIFREDNYIDVDGNFGPINQLIDFNNKLYFWQDNAFGIPSVNDRSLIQDTSGSELTLGTGDILPRFDYISNSIGSKHQHGFAISRFSIIWLDINTKSFYKFNSQGLKELQGLTGYFTSNLTGNIVTNDNPYTSKGCTIGYDHIKDEFLITCYNTFPIDTSFTVGFLDEENTFNSFYSFLPATYVDDRENIFTFLPGTGPLYLHSDGPYGEFYDTVYPFKITSIINQNPSIEKVFDSFRISSESFRRISQIDPENINTSIFYTETFDTYRAYNDSQNTGFIPLISNQTMRQVRRAWNVSIAGNQVKFTGGNQDIFDNSNIFTYPQRYPYTQRIKGPYCFLDLSFNNTSNNKLSLQQIQINYRINERSYK